MARLYLRKNGGGDYEILPAGHAVSSGSDDYVWSGLTMAAKALTLSNLFRKWS